MIQQHMTREKARYHARKFATATWGEDVKTVALDQVTAWEDNNGYSIWEVDFHSDDHSGVWIKVMNKDASVSVWGDDRAERTEQPQPTPSKGKFENTTTDIEIIKWYSLDGYEPIENHGIRISPTTAKFVFKDGMCVDVRVVGHLVRPDGELSQRTMVVPTIVNWNTIDWPTWLHDVRADAYETLPRVSKQ